MGNIILVLWFCLTAFFAIMCLKFEESGNVLYSNVFGTLAITVFFGLMVLFFIVTEKKQS